MDDALAEAMRDAELKEVHFTSPLALLGRAGQKRNWDGQEGSGGKWWKAGGKGKGKGKGKGGKGKEDLLSNTPDGRQICFNFNSASGCSTQGCTRVHICRVRGCGATDHGAAGHPANASA